MLTHRQTYLENALLSAAAVLLLLTTAAQSAVLSDNLQTTAAPALIDSSLTTQLNNSSMEEPRVLRSHTSCREEHKDFCKNGGECMYPQDTDEPSCICTSLYNGPRCFISISLDQSHSVPDLEKLIGIGFGVAMIIIFLAIAIYCLTYKRCIKSAPLIKSAPSETSV
ncbi:epigen-like [Centropristis striata]|uniref:epigen-like n=1 Tax=Centropristis striata TaxID=184440 RepID=UPI0027E12273|nr:epigen-like [Centropristis striata]